ncbi:MAG: hypothetical protein AUK63_704 [bacterium P3]|nr:MAG: hypothetical protein AUK63_704 [bacterium P3]KWW42187.1 MAG: hypothetical protein F083_526 [bacterium F083]
MTTHPTIDDALALIRRMQYDGQVDVADTVMQQVIRLPLLSPQPQRAIRRRVAAACLAVLLTAGTVAYLTSRTDNDCINSIVSSVYEYAYFNGEGAPICDEMAMANYVFE